MIEFYYRHFKNNYILKVNQLIKDVNRLMNLEGIVKESTSIPCIDKKYNKNLNNVQWNELNDIYFTLYNNKERLSQTLNKFICKNISSLEREHKFIDTFAGCGGLSLGLTNAGFNPVLVNEIEPKFLETYYFNHDLPLEAYYCADIKELVNGNILNDSKYTDVDLVVGGPPCQGFSMANRQRIIDDPRNELYKQYLKLLSKTRPRFFIMENVKGMMKRSEEILDNFKSTIGDDYSIRMILLNAKDFGIPQNRERVFVIGTRIKNVDIDLLIHNILSQKNTLPKYLLKDALKGLPRLESKNEKNLKGLENDQIGYKFVRFPKNKDTFSTFIGSQTDYLSNHSNRYNNERDIKIFGKLPQGANSLHPSIADIMPYGKRNHIFKDKYYRLKENEVCKTITSHMKFDCNMYIHPTQARGLSPREAARIQTFPDDYVFMGSNNIWYAQIGNAVPVKLAEVIGKEVMKFLK
jgi:DNA (cytosine-5)-methyltransferase 1